MNPKKGILASQALTPDKEETTPHTPIPVRILYLTTKNNTTYTYIGPDVPDEHTIAHIAFGPIVDAYDLLNPTTPTIQEGQC